MTREHRDGGDMGRGMDWTGGAVTTSGVRRGLDLAHPAGVVPPRRPGGLLPAGDGGAVRGGGASLVGAPGGALGLLVGDVRAREVRREPNARLPLGDPPAGGRHALAAGGDGDLDGASGTVLGLSGGALACAGGGSAPGGDGGHSVAPVAPAPVMGARHARGHDPRHVGPSDWVWDLSGDAGAVGVGACAVALALGAGGHAQRGGVAVELPGGGVGHDGGRALDGPLAVDGGGCLLFLRSVVPVWAERLAPVADALSRPRPPAGTLGSVVCADGNREAVEGPDRGVASDPSPVWDMARMADRARRGGVPVGCSEMDVACGAPGSVFGSAQRLPGIVL